jgi:lipopolysaccharide transport system permease protein
VTGYLSEIWRLRYFWMALVRNDLRSRYRRSMIGIGWSLLHPIAMTIILCIVFSRVFNNQESLREFAPRLLSGLTFWGFITAVVTQGCQCFFQGESYIRQHPAPLMIYPLRTTLGAGFHFLLGLGLAAVFAWSVNGFVSLPALLAVVPTLALLFVIGWSLAICAGLANVMFQDSEHLVEVVMQFMFYATPIIYPASMLRDRGMGWVVDFNPFAMLLELIQKPLLYGQLPSEVAVRMGAATGVAVVGIAALALMRFEKRLIFYL